VTRVLTYLLSNQTKSKSLNAVYRLKLTIFLFLTVNC